jgi:hypothetical protein
MLLDRVGLRTGPVDLLLVTIGCTRSFGRQSISYRTISFLSDAPRSFRGLLDSGL